jgi:hypothetical protein
MATTTAPRRTRFTRRIPDHVTDELVQVLQLPETFEFNNLFLLVYENLKKRNAVSGGEEMLRLRAYEKLQGLVARGMVHRQGKTYRGLEGLKNAIVPMPPRPVPVPVRPVETPAPAESNRLSVLVEEPKAKVTPLKVVAKAAPTPKATKPAAVNKPLAAGKALPKAATTAKAASAKAKPAKAKVAAKAPAKRVASATAKKKKK